MTPNTTRPRPGMTIIEVMFAVVIMSGVMLALSRFGQAFSRATREAAVVGIASDLATARLEVIRAYPNFDGLEARFEVTEAHDSTSYPSLVGYENFRRSTAITLTEEKSGSRVIMRYKTVTVTVASTAPGDSITVRKSMDIVPQ